MTLPFVPDKTPTLNKLLRAKKALQKSKLQTLAPKPLVVIPEVENDISIPHQETVNPQKQVVHQQETVLPQKQVVHQQEDTVEKKQVPHQEGDTVEKKQVVHQQETVLPPKPVIQQQEEMVEKEPLVQQEEALVHVENDVGGKSAEPFSPTMGNMFVTMKTPLTVTIEKG